MDKLARNASFNIIATLITATSGFLISIIATRILGQESFGQFSYVTWLFTTLIMLVDFGVSGATEKYVAELEGAGQHAVANHLTLALLITQCGIGLTTGFVLFTFSSWFVKILDQPMVQPYLSILALGIPVSMIATVLRSRLAGFQRYDLLSKVAILSAITTLVGTIVVLYIGLGVRGLVWLAICISCLQLVFFAFLVYKKYSIRQIEPIPTPLMRRLIIYCIGLFVWTTVDTITWQRSEIFFLGRYSTIDQVGHYSIAYSIAGIIGTMVPFAIAGVLMPALSFHYGAQDKDTIQQIYSTAIKYVVLFSLPICFLGIAIAKPAIILFYGVNYSPVTWPLRILLIASAAGAVGGINASLFLALGKTSLAGLWGIPIAILNLVLGFILSPPYGAIGASLANTICQVIGVMVSTIYLLHFRYLRLPITALFHIAIAASISAGLAFMITLWIPGLFGLLVSITVGAVVYSSGLILTGSLNSTDFQLLKDVSGFLPKFLSIRIFRLLTSLELIGIRCKQLFKTKVG